MDFKLSRAADKKYNEFARQAKKSIALISEMRLRDKTSQSLSKVDFERTYIDKTLGWIVAFLSAEIKGLTELLTKQAENDKITGDEKNA